MCRTSLRTARSWSTLRHPAFAECNHVESGLYLSACAGTTHVPQRIVPGANVSLRDHSAPAKLAGGSFQGTIFVAEEHSKAADLPVLTSGTYMFAEWIVWHIHILWITNVCPPPCICVVGTFVPGTNFRKSCRNTLLRTRTGVTPFEV